MAEKIVIIPIGDVDQELLDWVAERLAKVVERVVELGERVALPESGYNLERGQYLGEAMIAVLRGLDDAEASRLVGITDQDCYAPDLNFIFGQASLSGREAVVALPRLRQSYYGLPEDQELFRTRVLKEVIHELGHTWGLRHCPDHYCVMHFSNSLRDTDVKGVAFCPSCQERLAD